MQFVPQAWPEHPFHPDNHRPNLPGFPAASSRGTDIYTLQYPAVTAAQEAYVRKVIATVNDLDKVVPEVLRKRRPTKSVTMAQVTLNTGPKISCWATIEEG